MDSQSAGTLQSSTFSESSMVDSSRSGDDTEQEETEDFTKDNSTSPIDLECKIQAERITKILDEAVQKTKLALGLPKLVQEYHTLNSLLKPQHMDDLIYIFEQYDHPLFSSSLMNVSAMEDIKNGDLQLKTRLNPELGHLMYIMSSYPALKSKTEEIIEEMKADCSLQESPEIRPGLQYLRTLEDFRELMIKQLDTTAEEELASELHTRKIEASNEKLVKKIEDYTKTLKVESENFRETMSIKKELIAKLERELEMLERDADVKLKRKILLSERDMVLASRAHAVKQEILQEEEAETREAYENLLRTDLAEEKNLRMRRFKVETQLLSWLQKYDLEMGDKQIELDDFTEKYDEELRKCEDLELQLEEQDKEFIPLMEERDKEYHQEMAEKMNKFLIEHAARVIQSAWRQVLANRAEKKRLKKLRQKQAAIAAAAAAAEAKQKKKGK